MVLSTLYPGSIDTPTSLGQVVNRFVSTIGAGGATAAATTIPVTDTSGAPSSGAALITSGTTWEIVTFTGKTATSITGVTRGFDESVAQIWAAGAEINFDIITSAHHEALRGAIIATQTRLNATRDGLTLLNTTSFDAVGGQAVNNVFTSAYRNYVVQVNIDSQSAAADIYLRLRAGGVTDNTTEYEQSTYYNGSAATSRTGGLTSLFIPFWGSGVAIAEASGTFNFDNPALAVPTMFHGTFSLIRTDNFAYTGFVGIAHRLSAVYDGLTLLTGSGTMTGTMRIYGRQNNP